MVAPLARVVGLLARGARGADLSAERRRVRDASAWTGDLALSLETAERRAQRALLSAAGVLVEATAPRELLAVHDTLPVTVTVYNQGKSDVVLEGASVWMQNVYGRRRRGRRRRSCRTARGASRCRSCRSGRACRGGWRTVPDGTDMFTPADERADGGDNSVIGEDRVADTHVRTRAARRGRAVRVRRRPGRLPLRRSGARRAASARRVGAGDQPAVRGRGGVRARRHGARPRVRAARARRRRARRAA